MPLNPPDPQTLEAYEKTTPLPEWGALSLTFQDWIQSLPDRSQCLDVGCGNGTAVAEMLRCGHNAMGIDPSRTLVNAARQTLQKDGYPEDRIHQAALPDELPFKTEQFDAVSCCAVLMHLPEIQLFDALYELHRILRIGGRLFLSIPVSRPDVDPDTHRDAQGRLFTPVQPHQISLLCERMGLRLEDQHEEEDSLGREGVVWSSLSFTKLDGKQDCPLNRIEQILNHDKKDATYKLALVRALAEIAQTDFHLAHFHPNGKVAIPLGAIADRWLWYYWPLFAHERFICQKNGEQEEGGRNLAIRTKIKAVIDAAGAGGLSAFHAAWRRGTLDADLQRTWKDAHAKLKSTIWNMPVRFAGEGEEFSVFQYNRQTKNVEMDAGLWREFCLTGSWIQDATVLRWAELTEQLSRQKIRASEALDCLLTRWDPERDVNDARGYYLRHQNDLVCVWSGEGMGRRGFDVDHALPYTLWKNNDLWNLLPARSDLNNQKRDQLPSAPLLKARRDVIVEQWTGLKEEFGERFIRDAQTLMGHHRLDLRNWETPLYSRFTEACEVTATQRGVRRWQPADFDAPAATATVATPAGSYYPRQTEGLVMAREAEEPLPDSEPRIFSFNDVANQIYTHFLPLVGGLAAGEPFYGFLADGLEDPTQLDWLEITERLCGPKRFVVRVAGDSMEPTLPEESFAVFEYHRRAPEGRKIIIANLPEFGITGDQLRSQAIKYLTQDANHWIFESENPAYDPIPVPKADCPQHPILGEFVGRV